MSAPITLVMCPWAADVNLTCSSKQYKQKYRMNQCFFSEQNLLIREEMKNEIPENIASAVTTAS